MTTYTTGNVAIFSVASAEADNETFLSSPLLFLSDQIILPETMFRTAFWFVATTGSLLKGFSRGSCFVAFSFSSLSAEILE